MFKIISMPLILGAFLFVLMFNSQNLMSKDAVQLTVKITNTESNNGQLVIYLHNNPDYFPKEKKKAFRVIKSKIEKNTAKIIIKDIPTGKYAIAVHHDENGNNEVDTNFLGIPNEDFGASNNAKGFMGPPSFEDASFLIENDKTITINMD
ncbi:MAG: DUF2141 domain-containing protein [Ignavibacteriae bacterium]|mgnify:CR=1 FL=1|nr:DUF2141 domain-containing protein [Ignavibacteriota bacterium]MCB9220302.1 DUF2141 domain-containing protein [Ignavibacteria bacterium]